MAATTAGFRLGDTHFLPLCLARFRSADSAAPEHGEADTVGRTEERKENDVAQARVGGGEVPGLTMVSISPLILITQHTSSLHPALCLPRRSSRRPPRRSEIHGWVKNMRRSITNESRALVVDVKAECRQAISHPPLFHCSHLTKGSSRGA